MKNSLSFLIILALAVFSSACINNYAIQKLNEKAKDFSEQGELEEAAARLESSLDLDGSVYETRYNLAVIYTQMEKCDKALEQIEEASKLSKDEPALYYLKGLAYTCQSNVIKNAKEENEPINSKYFDYLKDANSSFEKYLKLSPDAKEKEDIQNRILSNDEIISQNNQIGSAQ